MAQSFDSWYTANSLPWESLQEAEDRYEQIYGVRVRQEEDQEDQGEDWLDRYKRREEEREREENYIADPDGFDQLGAGLDDAQASYGSAVAGPVSGFLSDYVSEDLGAYVKEHGEEVRDRNLEESAQVARPKSREEILKEDPDSWYKYLPESTPTGHEILRQTPTSLAAAGIALPAALAGGYVAGAAGLAGLGTMAVGGATGMLVGNTASSLQVAGESYERAKDDPLLREELGVDPNKKFEDLSPEEQKKMDRFATDVSQTAFGHRLYTSGAVEMASFIPYGGVLARYILDTGLGTASEVWDRSLFTEDAADTLVEYGMPKEKALEFQEKLLARGPGLWETFWPALVQEGLMGGVSTGVETAVTDHRVNSFATSTKFQKEQQLEAQKVGQKELEKEADANREANRAGFSSAEAMKDADNARDRLVKYETQVEKLEAINERKREREEKKWRKKFYAGERTGGEFIDPLILARDTRQERADAERARKEKIEEELAKLQQKKDKKVEKLQGKVKKQEAKTQPIRDAKYIKENSPLYNTKEELKNKPENIEIKRILGILPQNRRAEDKVELDRYKLRYGLKGLSEDLLLGKAPVVDAPIRTQEEIEAGKAGVDEKILREQKKANKNAPFNPLRFAQNLEPTKTTLFNKFKQTVGISTKTKKEEGARVKVSKEVMRGVADDIERRFKKFKGKFVVVDQNDVKSLASSFTSTSSVEGRTIRNDKGEVVEATYNENLAHAQEALNTGRAWTNAVDGKIYLNADGISGKTEKEVFNQIVELGMFHEPIAHLGLKKHLGDKFDGFLDSFYKTNKRDIDAWAVKTAAYLDGQDIKKIPQSKRRELAEEYLANNFVEFGVRDPNILARMADELTRGTLGVFGKDRITTVRAREILAEVQREYLGGKRNIVTGDFFDESNWLKPKKDTEVEEKKEEKAEFMKPIAVDRRDLKPVYQGALPAPPGLKFAKRITKRKDALSWKFKNKRPVDLKARVNEDELQKAAKKVREGKTSYDEYQELVERIAPIKKMNSVPEPATNLEIAGSIKSDQLRDGRLLGEDGIVKQGDNVELRLDIPAYEKYDTWVATIYHGAGKIYGAAAKIRNVTFKTNPEGSLKIAEGKNKTPLATMKGKWVNSTNKDLKAEADALINDPNWVQVGMNPERQSSFYARENKVVNGVEIKRGTPLASAEEVIQVGSFVLAKRPKTGEAQILKGASRKAGKEIRFSRKFKKQKAPKRNVKKMYGARALKYEFAEGLSATPFDLIDKKNFKGLDTPIRYSKQSLSNKEIASEHSLPLNKNLKDSFPEETVMLNPVGKIEYIRSKESGSLLGATRFSKSRFLNNLDAKTSKELEKKLKGKNIITLVGDRLKRGKYIPIHGDKSENYDKMKMLHGGPEYAFDLDNIGKKGRGAWASGEGRITVIANALKELKTNIGAIIVGSAEQHMSNMDFWNVMWGETLDASKLGTFDKDGNLKKDKNGNIKKLDINWLNSYIAGKGKLNADGTLQKNTKPLIELTYKTKEPDPKDNTKEITVINNLIPKKLKSKVIDFNSLMSLGKQLPFKSRKEILVKLFGDPSKNTVKDIMSKAKGIDITEIIRRTSAYPDSQVGDAVGLVEFDLDKNGEAIVGDANKMDVPPHPSYPTVIMGKAIAKYKYPVLMEKWGRDWLTSTKRYDQKGETGQRPFFPNKKQKKFEKTYFYTTDFLNYKRGFTKAQPSKEYTGEKSADQVRALAKRVIEMAPGQRELRVTKGMFPTKFSKKIGQQTAAQLEAEWRKKGAKVKPDTKLPEDKVTLGNNKEALDLYSSLKFSKKKLTPKETRIAKKLYESAGHHAIATRSWNPLAKLGEKYQNLPIFLGKTPQEFSDMLTKHIVAQGTLPDSAKYKALRRVVKGTILRAEDAGRNLYDILQNTKQADVIYNYFTTKGADPNAITNIKERNASIKAKKEIDDIGQRLVDRGLMREETRKSFEGQYLPRAYMSHLLGEAEFKKAVTRGGVGVDFTYLKSRKDIPEGIRKLVMGEIEDPAYLASKATTVPVKDLAILDWLDGIAANDNWVVPKTMVKFDTLGTLARLSKENKLSQSIIDSVDLKNTEGVNVSGMWLSKEASRIGEMMSFMTLTKGEETTLKSLIKKMKDASESAFGLSIDDKLYMEIPPTPKYGMLGGMYVRKEIYNDVFAGMEITTGDTSTVERLVGDGSVVQKYGRFWKWAKVPANPPSHIRNFTSNLILMQMSGMRVRDMPGLFINGLKDMYGGGEHGGKLYQLAKDLGLTAGGFSQAELGKIESEFKKLQTRMKKGEDSQMNIMANIKGALMTGMDKTTDFYGGIDSLGKMMMIQNELNKRGLKVKDLSEYEIGTAERQALDDAALNAEKWLFDYSNVKQSVRYLRNAPFGAPFMSFTSLVAPLMLETAITKPWKFAPYYALGWAMKEWFKENHDIDEEQLEALKLGLSEYLKEKADGLGPAPVVPLPYLDKNGRVQFLDVSYLYPWGMFSEMIGEISRGEFRDAVKTFGLFGSPVNNIASAISTGVDPFSRKPIVDKTGNFGEQAMDLWWYAYNLSMPSFLHGTGWGNEGFGAARRIYDAATGKIDKNGEPKFTMGQSISRMGGMNVTPLAVPEGRNKRMKFEHSQFLKLQRLAQRDIQNMYIMRMPKDEIDEKIKYYKEKINEAGTELAEKIKKSEPPMQLIKAREAFLRKNKQKAEEYRASL